MRPAQASVRPGYQRDTWANHAGGLRRGEVAQSRCDHLLGFATQAHQDQLVGARSCVVRTGPEPGLVGERALQHLARRRAAEEGVVVPQVSLAARSWARGPSAT